MKKRMKLLVVVILILLSTTMAGCVDEQDKQNETINTTNYSNYWGTPIRTSGDVIKVGYAQGVEETSIVEIVQEEYAYMTLIGLPCFVPKKIIGKTVTGKLVDVEFKETGFFFKKNNVVLTFEDSKDGEETTIITAKCVKEQIWQKGKVQEITIINGRVESVKIKNYEI